VYGLAHMERERARASMRMAGAFGISQAAEKSDRTEWWQTMSAAAGWR
jgi:hypothetical protein